MGKHEIGDYFKERLEGYNKEVDPDDIWSGLDLERKKKDRSLLFLLFGILICCLIIGLSRKMPHDKIENKKTSLSHNVESQATDAFEVDKEETLTQNSQQDYIRNIDTKVEASEDIGASEAQLDVKVVKEVNSSVPSKDYQFETKPKNNNVSKNLMKTVDSELSFSDSQNHQSTNPSLQPFTEIKSKSILDYLVVIPNRDMKLLSSFSYSDLKFPETIFPIEPKTKKQKSKRLHLMPYTGVFTFNKSFTLLSPEIDDHIKLRKEHEKPLEVITGGIGLQVQLTPKVYLTTGLEYQFINEKFEFSSVLRDTLLIDNAYLQPITHEQTTTESWVIYNSHVKYTIPVGIGYKLQKDRWDLGAQIASLFSFSEYKGSLLSFDNSEIKEPEFFNRGINSSIRMSAMFGYNLSNRFQLAIYPSYQRSISNLIKIPDSYKQSYSMYGILMGLKYTI